MWCWLLALFLGRLFGGSWFGFGCLHPWGFEGKTTTGTLIVVSMRLVENPAPKPGGPTLLRQTQLHIKHVFLASST